MRLLDLTKLSTRAFRINPVRTWLTISGVGIATAGTVVLCGFGFGLQNIFLEYTVFESSSSSFTSNVLQFNASGFFTTVLQMASFSNHVQGALLAFGCLLLVVSAIGMYNTMSVAMLERTRETGIMRTVGASPLDIKYLFITESIVIGFFGGVLGVFTGVTFGAMANYFIDTPALLVSEKSVALFSFPVSFLVFMIILAAAIGYLTGIIPARHAAATNPLDAIRNE